MLNEHLEGGEYRLFALVEKAVTDSFELHVAGMGQQGEGPGDFPVCHDAAGGEIGLE